MNVIIVKDWLALDYRSQNIKKNSFKSSRAAYITIICNLMCHD